MNVLFILILSLPIHSQEFAASTTSFKKIEVIAERPESAPESFSSGLHQNTEYKQSTDESLLEMANVGFAGGTNRPRYLQIRGQGETSLYENTPSHSVGSFVDDIDLTGISASWPMLNTREFTVFKGPQSVDWGGSVLGGKMNAQLNGPGTPRRARLSYESQNAVEAGTEFDLIKQSRFFLSFNSDPGFYKNTFRNSSGAARNEYYVSIKNNWISSDSWQVSSSHIGMTTHNNYDVWSLQRPGYDDDFETLSDEIGQDSVTLNGHSLRVMRKLNSTDSWVSLSSLTHSQSTYSYDADWGNNTYWKSIPGWNQNYDYFDEFLRQRTVWHQKIFYQRSHSSLGAHLYGLNEHSDANHYKNKSFKKGLTGDFNSASAALFADFTIPTGDANQILIGGRSEAQRIRYSDTQLPGVERTYHFEAFQVGAQHQFNDQILMRALITRGFKSPGVNIESELTAQDRFYNPEYGTNYELSWLGKNNSSFISVTTFLMNHEDKQAKVSRQDDPTDPSSFTYYTTNAARAISYGLEVAAQQKWNRWTTEAQLGFLNAEFRDYSFENKNLRGNPLAHAPSWSYAASLSRHFTERWTANVTVIGKNEFAFSNNHDQRSQAYHLVDLGSSYQWNQWALNLWLKNIFDERYQTRGFYFANEPPDWQNKLYVQNGPPRRAGISLTYAF